MIDKKSILRLKSITKLGIGKCHKALKAATGDVEKAIDLLRKEGQRIAGKRIGRIAEEGGLFGYVNDNKSCAVMLKLSAETDFVAKNEHFVTLGHAMAKKAVQSGVQDKEALLELSMEHGTVQEELAQLSAGVGENIAIADYTYLTGDMIGMYIHIGNKVGGLVALNKKAQDDLDLAAVAYNMALHVVVNDPLAINQEGIPAEAIAREKEMILIELKKANKANGNMIDKIVEGKMAKFYKENTLTRQPYFKDEQKSVREYLQGIDPKLSVVYIARLSI